MTLQEIEQAVSGLSVPELAEFSEWFEEHLAAAWDRRLEADLQSGRLDAALRRADQDFESGRCTPL